MYYIKYSIFLFYTHIKLYAINERRIKYKGIV